MEFSVSSILNDAQSSMLMAQFKNMWLAFTDEVLLCISVSQILYIIFTYDPIRLIFFKLKSPSTKFFTLWIAFLVFGNFFSTGQDRDVVLSSKKDE